MTNELGGSIEIDYIPSTSVDPVNETGNSKMGFNVWVVKNVTYNNSMEGSQNLVYKVKYDYSEPMYAYSEKEMRGFNYVNVTAGWLF